MNGETQRKAWEWLAVVFVLGAAIGGVFGYSFALSSHASTKASAPALTEAERRAKRVAEMTTAIGLTPDQSQKVDGIIGAAHAEMGALHDKCESDVDAVRQKARAQIREFLTDDQKTKYEAFVKHMDDERKKQQGK